MTNKPVLYSAAWESSCDFCKHQEDRHYCLLHTMTVKNMDMLRCCDWEDKERKPNAKSEE